MTGSRPPRYLLAGPAVDLSSKLESSCRPTCIQLSSATHLLIQNTAAEKEFEFHKLKNVVQSDDGKAYEAYVMDIGEWVKALKEESPEMSLQANVRPFGETTMEEIKETSTTSTAQQSSEHHNITSSVPGKELISALSSSSEQGQNKKQSRSRPADMMVCQDKQRSPMSIADAGEQSTQNQAPASVHHTPRSGRGIFSCFSSPAGVDME